jgi:hypothetical protein
MRRSLDGGCRGADSSDKLRAEEQGLEQPAGLSGICHFDHWPRLRQPLIERSSPCLRIQRAGILPELDAFA